jgi:WD40 repeat protein
MIFLYLFFPDKSGDVFKFDIFGNDVTTTSAAAGKCILGHLSMLLDIKLSNCGKFIITSDRDEKIRISHFPNAYNIHNFCLGHTDFVTAIEILPHFGSKLISSSSDGTLRLWDYLAGKEIGKNLCAQDANLGALPVPEPVMDNDLRVKRTPWPAVLNFRVRANPDKKSSTLVATIEA